MQAAKLYSFKDIRIEEVPIPTVGEGELLVKVETSGICSGDVVPWYIEKKAPLVPGHEPAGVVVKVGGGVTNFKEGDRIVLHHHAPCMECHLCRRHLFSMCPTWRRTNLDPGGMAQYVRLPKTNVAHDTLKLAAETSFEAGALVEPTACCVSAMRRLQINADDTLVVLGLGVMGILNIVVAKFYGVKQIIGVDRVGFRMQKALEVGADAVVDFSKQELKQEVAKLTDGRMATKIIVGPGSIAAMESAMELIGVGGTICLFTPTQGDERWSISPAKLYFEAVSVVASYSCGPTDTQEALRIVESTEKPFPTETLITHRFPLQDFAKAFELMAAAGDSLKVMIYCNP